MGSEIPENMLTYPGTLSFSFKKKSFKICVISSLKSSNSGNMLI